MHINHLLILPIYVIIRTLQFWTDLWCGSVAGQLDIWYQSLLVFSMSIAQYLVFWIVKGSLSRCQIFSNKNVVFSSKFCGGILSFTNYGLTKRIWPEDFLPVHWLLRAAFCIILLFVSYSLDLQTLLKFLKKISLSCGPFIKVYKLIGHTLLDITCIRHCDWMPHCFILILLPFSFNTSTSLLILNLMFQSRDHSL